MSFSKKREIIHYSYSIDDKCILRVSSLRDLGVYFDTTLSFGCHVAHIACSAFRLLGMITRLTRKFANYACFLRLFCSIIRSRLDFGSVVWNSLTLRDAAKIESVQRRFVRIIYDKYLGRRHFYNYELLLDKFGLQCLSLRRLSRDVAFLYKIVHGDIDSTLLFTVNFNVPTRSNRTALTFYPHNQHMTSPTTRMQTSVNNLGHEKFDIFDSYVNLSRQLDEIIFRR